MRLNLLAATALSALIGLTQPLMAADYETVALPGVKMVYLDTGGDGEPVVLVHALAGTSEHWKYQIDAFSDAGYRVIAYDRRGWGQSMADTETGPQPGVSSEDLDRLMEYLGLDKVHLVAIAGGSFVAMDYASLHQDKLMSLVLAASTGSIKDPEVADFYDKIRNPDVKWPHQTLEVGASYVGEEPEGLAEWTEIHERARQEGAPFQPLSSPNTLAKLETIETPTLVLAAGADQLAPPGLMRVWAPHLPNHEWAQIPEAGHSVAWERPEQFNTIVLEFLDAH